MNKKIISQSALRNTFLGLGLLLLAVALIGPWGGQEHALSHWTLWAFLAPSIPSQPHSEPSSQKSRISPFSIAMAFLVIFSAAASVWFWSESENYYRDNALTSFLIMLCLGCLLMIFKSVLWEGFLVLMGSGFSISFIFSWLAFL